MHFGSAWQPVRRRRGLRRPVWSTMHFGSAWQPVSRRRPRGGWSLRRPVRSAMHFGSTGQPVSRRRSLRRPSRSAMHFGSAQQPVSRRRSLRRPVWSAMHFGNAWQPVSRRRSLRRPVRSALHFGCACQPVSRRRRITQRGGQWPVPGARWFRSFRTVGPWVSGAGVGVILGGRSHACVIPNQGPTGWTEVARAASGPASKRLAGLRRAAGVSQLSVASTRVGAVGVALGGRSLAGLNPNQVPGPPVAGASAVHSLQREVKVHFKPHGKVRLQAGAAAASWATAATPVQNDIGVDTLGVRRTSAALGSQ